MLAALLTPQTLNRRHLDTSLAEQVELFQQIVHGRCERVDGEAELKLEYDDCDRRTSWNKLVRDEI